MPLEDILSKSIEKSPEIETRHSKINGPIPSVFRLFTRLDEHCYNYVKKLKRGTKTERLIGHSLGNLTYAVIGTILSFPNGNAMPSNMQKHSLALQGRNRLTYSLWGLSTDTAWQSMKLYLAYSAASTETVPGYIAAGGIGIWTSYKFFEIPARTGLIAMRKEPMPFLIIEAVNQGYMRARKGIAKLNPAKKMKDTLMAIKKLYRNPK